METASAFGEEHPHQLPKRLPQSALAIVLALLNAIEAPKKQRAGLLLKMHQMVVEGWDSITPDRPAARDIQRWLPSRTDSQAPMQPLLN